MVKNKYLKTSSQALLQQYNVDVIEDIILCRENRLILYTDISKKEQDSVRFHIISGSLKTIGFDDTESILLSDIFNHFDYNNKYGEVAGKLEYYNNIYNMVTSFQGEINVTFPLIVNDVRKWLRFNILPVVNHETLYSCFITDVTEFVIEEEKLFEKSHKDPLTQLFNKYTLDFHYGKRYKNKDFHVLFMDLDDFKEVNDTKGHNVGNDYLKAFADILKSLEKDNNHFYRLGGDEFVGLFFGKEDYIRHVADEIIERTKNIKTNACDKQITVSIGIVSATKSEDVIKKADKILYQAKEHGKNRYIYKIES